MKHRSAATILAAVMAVTMTACGSKKSSDSSNVDLDTYKTPTKAPVQPVSAEEGALLSISNTTAIPGGVAEVTVHVENAEMKWNMCGLHISYPDSLKPRLLDEEKRIMDREIGPAAKYNDGFIGMAWFDNLPEELTKENKGCFFLTTMVGDNQTNKGLNGDIATFYFDVPDNAAPGTVYDIEFFYQDGDMFSNNSRNPGYDQFAFDNWKNGTVTVG